MTTRKFYRADKRNFDVGDEVASAFEFLTKHPEGILDVERIFEEERPSDCPPRTSSVYVFEDSQQAKKYWCKLRGGKLYEVEVDLDQKIHRADMTIAESDFAKRENPDAVRECAKRYWSGAASEHCVIEVLVTTVRVTRVISKDEGERLAQFRDYAFGHPAPILKGE